MLQDTSLAASSSQAKHETWLWPKPQLTPSSKGGDVTSAASCFLGASPLPVPRRGGFEDFLSPKWEKQLCLPVSLQRQCLPTPAVPCSRFGPCSGSAGALPTHSLIFGSASRLASTAPLRWSQTWTPSRKRGPRLSSDTSRAFYSRLTEGYLGYPASASVSPL